MFASKDIIPTDPHAMQCRLFIRKKGTKPLEKALLLQTRRKEAADVSFQLPKNK